jgi:hypothetical protein
MVKGATIALRRRKFTGGFETGFCGLQVCWYSKELAIVVVVNRSRVNCDVDWPKRVAEYAHVMVLAFSP